VSPAGKVGVNRNTSEVSTMTKRSWLRRALAASNMNVRADDFSSASRCTMLSVLEELRELSSEDYADEIARRKLTGRRTCTTSPARRVSTLRVEATAVAAHGTVSAVREATRGLAW